MCKQYVNFSCAQGFIYYSFVGNIAQLYYSISINNSPMVAVCALCNEELPSSLSVKQKIDHVSKFVYHSLYLIFTYFFCRCLVDASNNDETQQTKVKYKHYFKYIFF